MFDEAAAAAAHPSPPRARAAGPSPPRERGGAGGAGADGDWAGGSPLANSARIWKVRSSGGVSYKDWFSSQRKRDVTVGRERLWNM